MRKRKDGTPRSTVTRVKDPLPYVTFLDDMMVRSATGVDEDLGEDTVFEFKPRPGFLQREEDYE